PLRGDPRADDAVLGRTRVHHRRARARHPPSAGESAVRDPGARVGTPAAGRRLRATHQPLRRRDERRRGGVVVPRRRPVARRRRVTPLVAPALVAAVGTSVDLFMPIRAHFDPYLNEGEPTSWAALHAVLTREQFGKPSIFDNPMYPPGPDNPGHTLALYGQQLLNYVHYFTWQFGHDWLGGVQRALAVLFATLGLA